MIFIQSYKSFLMICDRQSFIYNVKVSLNRRNIPSHFHDIAKGIEQARYGLEINRDHDPPEVEVGARACAFIAFPLIGGSASARTRYILDVVFVGVDEISETAGMGTTTGDSRRRSVASRQFLQNRGCSAYRQANRTLYLD